MLAYDVSPDGKQVVFEAAARDGGSTNCGSPQSTEVLPRGNSAISAARGRTLDRAGRSCFRRRKGTSITWNR